MVWCKHLGRTQRSVEEIAMKRSLLTFRCLPVLLWKNPDTHHTASSRRPDEGGVHSFSYKTHIPRVGSTQRMIDVTNGALIETTFINLENNHQDVSGQNWAARIEGNPLPGYEVGGNVSPIWYFYLEGEGSLVMVPQENESQVSTTLSSYYPLRGG